MPHNLCSFIQLVLFKLFWTNSQREFSFETTPTRIKSYSMDIGYLKSIKETPSPLESASFRLFDCSKIKHAVQIHLFCFLCWVYHIRILVTDELLLISILTAVTGGWVQRKNTFTDNVLLKIFSNVTITSLVNEINKLFHDLWVWRWIFHSLCLAYANTIYLVRDLVILILFTLRQYNHLISNIKSVK